MKAIKCLIISVCLSGGLSACDDFFADCMSDIAYSFTGSSSYKNVSNGSLSSTSTVGYYSYTTIRRCNLVLENAGQVSFTDEVKKEGLVGTGSYY